MYNNRIILFFLPNFFETLLVNFMEETLQDFKSLR